MRLTVFRKFRLSFWKLRPISQSLGLKRKDKQMQSNRQEQSDRAHHTKLEKNVKLNREPQLLSSQLPSCTGLNLQPGNRRDHFWNHHYGRFWNRSARFWNLELSYFWSGGIFGIRVFLEHNQFVGIDLISGEGIKYLN